MRRKKKILQEQEENNIGEHFGIKVDIEQSTGDAENQQNHHCNNCGIKFKIQNCLLSMEIRSVTV